MSSLLSQGNAVLKLFITFFNYKVVFWSWQWVLTKNMSFHHDDNTREVDYWMYWMTVFPILPIGKCFQKWIHSLFWSSVLLLGCCFYFHYCYRPSIRVTVIKGCCWNHNKFFHYLVDWLKWIVRQLFFRIQKKITSMEILVSKVLAKYVLQPDG